MEEHNKVRHRLREFKRRHNEFRHVIGLGEHVTPIPFDTNLQQATMVDVLGKTFVFKCVLDYDVIRHSIIMHFDAIRSFRSFSVSQHYQHQ